MSNAKPAPITSSPRSPWRARFVDRVLERARSPADTRRGCRCSPARQPVAKPAIVSASITANGSSSIRTRSLNVPGSDSSALQIEVVRPHRLLRDGLPLHARSGTPRRRGRGASQSVTSRDRRRSGPSSTRAAERLVPAVRAIVLERRRIDEADAAEQPRASRAAPGVRVCGADDAPRDLGDDRRAAAPRRGTAERGRRSRAERQVRHAVARRAGRTPAGARSHRPRHGLRSTSRAPSAARSRASRPSARASRRAPSPADPAREVVADMRGPCGGRGSVENIA